MRTYHSDLYCPEQDSNLGLSETHRVNYEAATSTTRPPWPDTIRIVNLVHSSIYTLTILICFTTFQTI